MRFDMDSVRADFPLIVDSDVVYLDNAATTQKPRIVLDALRAYYETYNANVHRAAHNLSDKATEAFERARKILAHRINAERAHEVILGEDGLIYDVGVETSSIRCQWDK